MRSADLLGSENENNVVDVLRPFLESEQDVDGLDQVRNEIHHADHETSADVVGHDGSWGTPCIGRSVSAALVPAR